VRFKKDLLFFSSMKVKHSEELAEIVGIMFGDGCIYKDRLGKYQVSVSFNKKEQDYLLYVKKLFSSFFVYKFCISEQKNEFLLRNTSVYVGSYLIKSGLSFGNKIKNKIVIPDWIFRKRIYALRFLRGIFDTDGCVYKKYGSYCQIQFKFGCRETTLSLWSLMWEVGFKPSQAQLEKNKSYFGWKFYLCRQKEIDVFFSLVNPKNMKNWLRYKKIKNGAAGI
jgi:hypothetical protein